MTQMMISQAIEKWLENNGRAFVRYDNTRFVFTDGTDGRAALFMCRLWAEEDAVRAEFVFPVEPHEDEQTDLNYALETINAALKIGYVHYDRYLPTVELNVGVWLNESDDSDNVLSRINRFGVSFVESLTPYLARILLNGRAAAPVLPPIETGEAEGLRMVSRERIMEWLAPVDAEEDEDEEYREPEKYVRSRLRDVGGEPAPAYLAYRKYMDECFPRALTGNNRNHLVWSFWMNGRAGKMLLELESDPDSYCQYVSLGVRPSSEELERVQRLLDGMNRQLRYGAMFIDERSGLIRYRIRLPEHGGKPGRYFIAMRIAREMISSCSDGILRAMFDDNIDTELCLALCREGVEALNEACKAECLVEKLN